MVTTVETEPAWALRRATAEDADLLTDMLVAAVNWGPLDMTRQEVMSHPELAHYVDGWPRAGDLGVVAVAADAGTDPHQATAAGSRPGGTRVGGAWLRTFAADDPGFGTVEPGVPELSVGVVEAWRGRGVGRSLLRRLVAEAAREGVTAISLSVERANRARLLYLSEGFEIVSENETDYVMLLRPVPAAPSASA